MVTYVLVNTGSVMACFLMHQASAWTNVQLISLRFCGFHVKAIELETFKDMSLTGVQKVPI